MASIIKMSNIRQLTDGTVILHYYYISPSNSSYFLRQTKWPDLCQYQSWNIKLFHHHAFSRQIPPSIKNVDCHIHRISKNRTPMINIR